MTAEAPSKSKAVVDGKLTYTSVSAITTFDPSQYGGCQRRWFYRYVAGLEEQTTVAQTAGTNGHKQIEHYLKTGEKALGPVVLAGIEHIPEPGPDLLVEHYFNGELVAHTPAYDVPLKGFIDLVNPRDGVEVRDWKFTGDLKNAKTGPQLLETVQMTGYGVWALDKYQAPEVRLTHVYFQTRGMPDARKSSVMASADDLRTRWARVESVVGQMTEIATRENPTDVPINERACMAWGGCPHRFICPKTEGVVTMGLINALNKTLGIPATATVTEPTKTVTTMEAPTIPPQIITTGAELADVLASGDPNVMIGILPADAPESKPELAAKPIEDAPAPVTEKKRGRPKKSDTTTTTTTTPVPVYAEQSSTAGLWIFVDVEIASIPSHMRGMVESLDTYIDGACEALAGQYGAADIRCADGNSPLGFGKWKGALAALVKARPPEAGYYSVGWVRGNEIKETVIEALRPACELLVRGNR